MRRRLLVVLVVLLGAGASFAQDELYAAEVIAGIRAVGGAKGYEFGAVLEGESPIFALPAHPDLQFTVDGVVFRNRAISALREGANKPNGVIACGTLGYCEGVGNQVFMGFYSFGYAYLTVQGWYVGSVRHINGSQQKEVGKYSSELAGAIAAVLGELGGVSGTIDMRLWEDVSGNMLTYVDVEAMCGVSVCDDFPTRSQFVGGLISFLETGIAEAEPTVTELVAEWGVSIVGAYVDAGYSDGSGGGGDGNGGGGGPGWDDAPADPDTNCSIIDIPCNLRRLFVPQVEWGAEFGSIDYQEKLPFALASWIPQLDCSGEPSPDTGIVACGISGIDNDRAELQDDETPGVLSGSLQYRVRVPHFGIDLGGHGPGVEYYEFDLKEVPYIDLWHRHIRTWLFWMFVAAFVLGALQRFLT